MAILKLQTLSAPLSPQAKVVHFFLHCHMPLTHPPKAAIRHTLESMAFSQKPAEGDCIGLIRGKARTTRHLLCMLRLSVALGKR
ncbi:hypothetical protein DND47_07855 [Pseudomonas syringae pv. syringae]|nr:hypothetical protein DND47_07855 [Pseudomonas syringae pv. syringae]